MNVTLAQAEAAIQAAIKKAADIGTISNIAVIDAGVNLTAFARMDNAWLGSIDIAIKKAKTARFFNMPSSALGKMSQPGQPLYGIEVSNNGLISFAGGVLLISQGQIIGAIGVSGGTADEDEQVAKAGAEAVK